MKAIPIRTRLTAWYFLILATALIGFALFALRVMQKSIYTAVDEQLEDRARDLQALIARSSSGGNVATEISEHAELQSGSQLFQVSDSAGQFLYRSPLMQRLGVPAARTDRQQFADAQYGDLPIRILTAPATAGSRNFVVQVAEPMDDFVEAIDRFRSVLWFGIPVLLLAAAGGGYWLSAFALRPVDRITRAAQSITPQDLSQRLTVPQTGDELQRLGETLNKMLQRIESAVLRITQFTADASHELRTPVALIRTRAEVTLANPRTNDQYREALSEVLVESERTSALIENLMLLARADTGAETLDFQRTDVSALARAVSAQAQTLAEAKELKWNAAVPDVPIWVLGDPQALRRLLLILIDNAVKYTPENGSISLALETYDNHAAIRVEDTGMGISEADLTHIFERFYRADKARSRELGGTGLGLSIGRWIANAHGGEIKVQSSPAGSTFIFRLPLVS